MRQGSALTPGPDLPQVHRRPLFRVAVGGCQELAVDREREGPNITRMRLERRLDLLLHGINYLYAAVADADCQPFAIRRQGQGAQLCFGTNQGREPAPGRQLPENDRSIRAGRRQFSTVFEECQRINPGFMSFEQTFLFPGVCMPEADAS